MTVTIERADFDEPGLATFLQDHLDDLVPTAPQESRHALQLADLRRPDVRLWVAVVTDDPIARTIVGTGALAALEPGHEELKSMRTDPARRGQGIGRRMLRHLLTDARSRGVRRLSLETGSMDFFAPARALYAAEGFVDCPPFGNYIEDRNSVFMTRLEV
ncbi:GNAT family N-acetyltransferase [Microlunatus soli]|uniref:Putative acetyltransferase n=1 Tax=Microlunatus soli TaxID=630515 RepID=A0A1H1RVH5_9ACTN|nr:GNAT family N-acetyltransferase [Microlunatus soli]SDS39692.1 putative acetyltransferase [Microlunatus soli]